MCPVNDFLRLSRVMDPYADDGNVSPQPQPQPFTLTQFARLQRQQQERLYRARSAYGGGPPPSSSSSSPPYMMPVSASAMGSPYQQYPPYPPVECFRFLVCMTCLFFSSHHLFCIPQAHHVYGVTPLPPSFQRLVASLSN